MTSNFIQKTTFFAALASSILVLLGISFESISNLPTYWNKDEYSHGYIIPIVTAYLGWHELSKQKYTVSSSWHGLYWLGLSIFLSLFAKLSASEAFLNYSFIIGLFGVSYAFFGARITKAIFPALFFLFYAAPLPHIVFGHVSIQMQLISSSLGTAALQAAGYTVFQEGNIIDLGYIKLHVEEACNGLRYLFPLMSLGYISAYLLKAALWKKFILMVSVIPITIIMNALRIAMVGITVNVWGPEMAEGIMHILEGYVVFTICLFFLMLEIWIIIKISKNDQINHQYLNLPGKIHFYGCLNIGKPAQLFCALCCISILGFYALSHITRLEFIRTTPNLDLFPVNILEWKGKRDFLTSAEIKNLDLSDYWMANYTLENTDSPVNFYVAYYDNQKMRANIHIPLNCILASGWSLDSQTSISVNTQKGEIPVKRLLIRKGSQRGIVYYWLEQRGRRLSNPIEAKLYLMWDSIVINRTDGALVRVASPISTFENPEKADERIQKFIRDTYPKVNSFIPGK